MSDRYRLVALANAQLVAALAGLVRRENDALSDLLAHLAELDERRLYLDLGFTSLFAYCTEALGFCKSSAGRRIAAARVCRRYPEAFARVAKGELQLSVLSVLNQYLNPENAAELFEACSNKSYEQVELLLAVRFPKPDVRDLIRRLPAKSEALAGGTPDIGSGLDGTPSASAAAGTADHRQMKAETAPADPPTPERGRIEPLSADRFGVHFTADTVFRELLDEVRALASHGLPKGELLPLMKRALQAYRSELRKNRFGVGRKPRRARDTRNSVAKGELPSRNVEAGPANAVKRSRHVPANVAREIYRRDDGCCTFVSDDGRRCAARQFLEIDHAKPWAESGLETVENLRLRCRAHNLRSATKHFGADHIRDAVARARGKTRVPVGGQL
ncbi:MAG TPA: HNH endonuclease signature motif containing protein [Polyangiaceae bacterium]